MLHSSKNDSKILKWGWLIKALLIINQKLKIISLKNKSGLLEDVPPGPPPWSAEYGQKPAKPYVFEFVFIVEVSVDMDVWNEMTVMACGLVGFYAIPQSHTITHNTFWSFRTFVVLIFNRQLLV